MTLTFLTGGARSGKSTLAVTLARTHPGPVVVIATAEGRDDEMRDRIRAHRAERPATWETIEEPIDLLAALRRTPTDAFVIVDCLTLWVANLLERGVTDVAAAARSAADCAAARVAATIVVSNEVGLGLVPMHPLGRAYRDAVGQVNAIFAGAASAAFLVVAGRLLRLETPPSTLGALGAVDR